MHNTDFIQISSSAVCQTGKIVSIVPYDSAPIRRMIQEAREDKRLVDATGGQKTRGVIVTESNHIVLSPMEVNDLLDRINNEPKKKSK